MRGWVFLLVLLAAAAASAHGFAPAVVEIQLSDHGAHSMRLRAPVGFEVTIGPPCERLACSAEELARADFGLRGDAPLPELFVDLRWPDGRRELRPAGAGYAAPAPGFVATVRLGAEHILGGIDHLLFVVGLVALGGGWRRITFTLTAFTIGHSLALAAIAAGLVRPASAPVELLVAVTLLLLGRELARPSRSRVAPRLALAFGLVHGGAFAGAFADLGVAPGVASLFGFNLGVELGQLAVVAALLVVAPLLRGAGRTLVAHALGAVAVALLLAAVAGCSGGDRAPADTREPCARRDPLKQLFFGDLHVHTGYSFDANAFDVGTTPDQAYDFARGAEVELPFAGGTQRLRIDRPLDFAAVTDHSEFLGEVEACTVPGSDGYDDPSCTLYRTGGNTPLVIWALGLAGATGRPQVCGGTGCPTELGEVWARIQDAAERAYDRTAACGFTSFVGYEYSAAPAISTMHRNVLFRSRTVPAPATYFENKTPQELWAALETTCRRDEGCEWLAIPHNSNESNGNMFYVEYPGASSVDEQREAARRRAEVEPLVEIYQHKSSSECMNEVGGILGGPDEECNFELHRRVPFEDCGDAKGSGGASRTGCFSRYDFVRGVLLAGLGEQRRLGVNPYRLGFVGSTDTHNGTPGAVAEETFVGHRGTDDDTPAKRLAKGGLTPGGIEFSPGGLAAVWAEENSREAIFDALRRREVYATSGPRIAARVYAGWDLPADLCSDPQLVAKATAAGVPMGGVLPAGSGAPRFVVSALKDPGTADRPGADLERIELVKGWLDAGGAWHQQVVEIARAAGTASVNVDTCERVGAGAASLCAVWQDDELDAAQPAFYYARVLEVPSCRWSTFTCNALPVAERPPSCTDPNVAKIVRERAWSSPIWYTPAGSVVR